MRKITLTLIIALAAVTAFAGGFSRDNDTEIVTDSTNNRMWQDSSTAGVGTYTRTEAFDYCAGLFMGGYNDWRLPNINELRSIVNYGAYHPAAYTIFQNAAAEGYWSSTTSIPSGGSTGYYIDFEIGQAYSAFQSNGLHVRCVR